MCLCPPWSQSTGPTVALKASIRSRGCHELLIQVCPQGSCCSCAVNTLGARTLFYVSVLKYLRKNLLVFFLRFFYLDMFIIQIRKSIYDHTDVLCSTVLMFLMFPSPPVFLSMYHQYIIILSHQALCSFVFLFLYASVSSQSNQGP